MKKTLTTISFCLLLAGAAQAAIWTWDGPNPATSRWDQANWLEEDLITRSTPASLDTTDLVFTNGTNNSSITRNNWTVRSITFDDTIGANGHIINIFRSAAFDRTLTFSADSGNSSINITSGSIGDISIIGAMGSTRNGDISLGSSLDIVHEGTGTLTISAPMKGTNGFTKTGTGSLTLSGVNTYTGNTVINGGAVTLSDNAELLFQIGATAINNEVSGNGIANFNGEFRFDLAAAGTTVGDAWQIVDVTTLTETFSSTFSALTTNGSFTESGDEWTIYENSVGYEFSELTGMLTVIPEPSTSALLLGGISMLALRRRRN